MACTIYQYYVHTCTKTPLSCLALFSQLVQDQSCSGPSAHQVTPLGIHYRLVCTHALILCLGQDRIAVTKGTWHQKSAHQTCMRVCTRMHTNVHVHAFEDETGGMFIWLWASTMPPPLGPKNPIFRINKIASSLLKRLLHPCQSNCFIPVTLSLNVALATSHSDL